MANQIINGSDLMVFVGEGAAMKSLAYATSCSLSLTTETQSIASKDHGKWGGQKPLKNNWEVSSDNLYTSEDFATLFGAYSDGTQLNIVFNLSQEEGTPNDDGTMAPVGGWTPKTTGGYSGKAYITNINVNAPDGDNATYSVTFGGSGAFTVLE